MRIINASGTDTIVLGYPGEHERTKVRFYYGDIKSEFPEGTLMLQVRRPGDNTKYDVELEPDGYYAYWLVSDYDLVNEGTGECQLIYATTTAVSKKKVWKTQVEKGIKGKNIGIPPTWESIETRLLTAATTLQATIDETEERLDAAEERMDLIEQDVASAQQAAIDAASSATEAVNTAQQAIVDIHDATAAGVDTVNAEVIKAEGWAEGTANGQPADEYADKSAKHWAEQASSSADESANSASSAAASQASAASSESNAETYMRGAEQHKIGAETAAAEAESSATDAETAMAAAQAAQAAAEASRDSAAEFYDEVAASVSEAQRAEQEAEVAANDAEANALVAEGWAQGTQNGVPVADGEYYQNNAEYWAGIATDNAARTDTLAGEALRSMQAAGVSETNAASYAAAANTSANNANASAAQAYQSEQNAALSQVNAQNSQSAARVSAEKAARSESAAAGSASTAEAAVNRYNNMSAVATTLEAEAEATASIDHSGSAPVLRLGIPKGNVGRQGEPGPQGVTFTPSVDAEGNLSWTNNGNVQNPPTVNIKGRPGEPGTSVEVHVCGSAEYDENGVPTVQNPDVNTFYLVPDANVDGQDMFVEWVNVDGSWEIFGSARVDLSNYVQKTDYASSSVGGVVKVNGIYGLRMVANDGPFAGVIGLTTTTPDEIKAGNNTSKPIETINQHQAAFYGLAKAAGHDEKDSELPVGQYTDEAKAAIQQMLDVPSTSDMSTYATKVDTVLDTTLSLGRLANSDVGENSVALGYDVTASGYSAFAEGYETAATSDSAHAEGENTQATDSAAHAEGTYTQANGYASHAEGDNTIAEGYFAHAEGTETTATGLATHVFGERNFNCNEGTDVSLRGTMVEIVGNGQENVYSNARALTWTGDEYLAGNLYVNANGTSTSGTRVATVTEIPEVPVQDVQVGGTSIVDANGNANIPVADANTLGIVGVATNDATISGIKRDGAGKLTLVPASSSDIKTVTANVNRPVIPNTQHESTFYGLAKAAGDTTQAESENAVGNYTDEAKSAIQTMLDVPSAADLSLKADKTDTVLETTLSRGRTGTAGAGSIAFGEKAQASGIDSIAVGFNVNASGRYSTSFGAATKATGDRAVANGMSAVASGPYSHAEGDSTVASGAAAYAGGAKTESSGSSAFATGRETLANKDVMMAVGSANTAASQAEEYPTWVSGTLYHVGDKVYNPIVKQNFECLVENNDVSLNLTKWRFCLENSDTLFVVGNGKPTYSYFDANNSYVSVPASRSNAFRVDWDGNGKFNGDIYVGANADSSGGTKVATVAELATKLDAAEAGLKVVRLI